MELGRLLTAMVTPLDDEGRVNYDQAQRLAGALLDSGSDGLVVAGTTGEAPTLTHDEKVRLFKAVKEAVDGRGAVIAGTGTYNTAESVELSRDAERVGADGVLLTTPYYSKPTQEGIFRHFETIARAVHIPVVLYNIPARTGVNVTAETMLRLAHVPNVVGVKEASGDLRQIARIVEDAPDYFCVWSGDDEMTLPILGVGGYGVIAVASHLAGSQMREMIEAHFHGDPEKAARLHRRLLPLFGALMSQGNPMGIKYALNELGFGVGPFRLPLCEPDADAGERIMAEVRRHHIDLAVGV
jgi:4-hydroxy-tetrahydrodipicolinate synthase